VEATVQSRIKDDGASDTTGETVIPLLTEEIAVAKQVIETDRVQVARVTHEGERLIDEGPLAMRLGATPQQEPQTHTWIASVRLMGEKR
jgi:hypothetical protein